MGLFKKRKVNHSILLQESCAAFAKTFFEPFEEFKEKINQYKFIIFVGGFNLACYAIYKPTFDERTLNSLSDWISTKIFQKEYLKLSLPRFADEEFEPLLEMIDKSEGITQRNFLTEGPF